MMAPSETIIRAVWQAVCRTPHASLDELRQSCRLGSNSTVHRAIHELKRRGALTMQRGNNRSIVIRAVEHQGHAYRIEWL